MPALSFSVFRDKLISGQKSQTIRKERKRPIKVGDTLQIYWKQRSPKESQKLFEAKCIKVQEISIDCFWLLIKINGEVIEDQENFAYADGFDSAQEFFEFFRANYGNKFKGVVIHFAKKKGAISP